MAQPRKTLDRLLRGQSDADIRFSDLRRLLLAVGFEERIRGGHYIYSHEKVVEIINLPSKGGMAKPYQVKQVRQPPVRYRLGGEL
ncbi:MAG TPA: type II toxin-antitoxin system HicA family toxin [Phycisphaerae bacterium]|nr:type II toxin-antitoxin system HicA family toxin [Phycisphaerae bacterium]